MKVFLPFAVLAIIPAIASSQNLVFNGSFESATGISTNSTLEQGATNLDGWTVVGGGNLIWCDSSVYCARPASDGQFLLDLTGLTNVVPYAGVSQVIVTTPGTQYTLAFSLAGRNDSTPVSVSASAGLTSGTFSNQTELWETERLTFTATANATTITILGSAAGGSGLMLALDNVSVSVVPEPPAAGLFALGLSLLSIRRFRTRRITSAA